MFIWPSRHADVQEMARIGQAASEMYPVREIQILNSPLYMIKSPPVYRRKNKYLHRWQDKGRFYGDTWTFVCKRGCGCEAIKASAFSWTYYKNGIIYYRAPECVPTQKDQSN